MLFVALAFLAGWLPCVGGEAIHLDWIEDDRDFVQKVKVALQKDPEHVDQVLFRSPVKRNDLGFGYSLARRYVGKGYLGFWCQMLYQQDKLVSFRVTPSVGMAKHLTPIYVEMLRDVFPPNADGTFESFCYNPEAAMSALPGSDTKAKMSGKVQWFCSPFSGIEYGTIGGYAGGDLPNRRAYLDVAEEIDGDLCLRLLYSINPATRLTAYEHYRRRPVALASIKDQVETRIRQVLKALPRVETMEGCFFKNAESQKVLEAILGTKLEEISE